MARKSKFIVNRHTWSLDQFEFSLPCSYEECLVRLRALEVELHDHYSGSGVRPVLKMKVDTDASSFELILQEAIVTGTVQQITDETTLFVGLSQFSPSFYMIIVVCVIMGLVLAIVVFLSAYVSSNPSSVWSIDTLRSALSAGLVVFGGVLFYPLFRWKVWRAVDRLVSAVDDCGDS